MSFCIESSNDSTCSNGIWCCSKTYRSHAQLSIGLAGQRVIADSFRLCNAGLWPVSSLDPDIWLMSKASAQVSHRSCPEKGWAPSVSRPVTVWDADVGIWSCGEHVVMSETYHNIRAHKGTCLADCSLSASPLALPSQYYYQVSEWSSCSDACDGGFQTRSITCHNSQDGGCALFATLPSSQPNLAYTSAACWPTAGLRLRQPNHMQCLASVGPWCPAFGMS